MFWEYYNYRDVTAHLLELQAKYESYLLIMKQTTPSSFLEEDKKFLQVDRSDINLRTLLKEDEPAVVENVQPVARSKKGKRRSTGNADEDSSKALFSWPVAQDSFWISSFFGPRRMGRVVRMHAGIDLAAMKGTPVKAAASGKVIKACYEFGYGNTVVIEHNRKYKTRYAHLDKIFVERGDAVLRGQKIGAVGDTGFVQAEGNNASHLHFEVYAFNKQVNPIRYLPRR